MPDKYDLVVGDTFQLFYRGIIEAPNPFCYDILAVCKKGKGFPRYFEFTPTEEEEPKLTVSVFDAGKNLLGQAETTLVVKAPVENKKPLNILCIGSSTTAGGQWPGEARRRLAEVGGEPEGLGFKNVNFIGTCGKEDVHFEGYGGWMWKSYLSIANNNVWVTVDYNQNTEDQHSIWRDEQGFEWKLETLDIKRLKFLPYGDNPGKKPEPGRLVHVANAVHTDDIVFSDSYYEKISPFYDEETDSISFKAYCKKLGIEKIDAIYVMLGINGLLDAPGDILDHCAEVVRQAKEFADIFHKEFPDGKIKVMGSMMSSVTGGVGWNYGAVLPCCDGHNLRRYILKLNEHYQAWAKEAEYSDFIEYINISGQFDCDNAYPEIEKPVNLRSKKTEMIGTNGVHPLDEGYMQVADAVFRNMVHFCLEN